MDQKHQAQRSRFGSKTWSRAEHEARTNASRSKRPVVKGTGESSRAEAASLQYIRPRGKFQRLSTAQTSSLRLENNVGGARRRHVRRGSAEKTIIGGGARRHRIRACTTWAAGGEVPRSNSALKFPPASMDLTVKGGPHASKRCVDLHKRITRAGFTRS